MRILRLQNTSLGGGQDTQAMVSSPPQFIADYVTSKTGSWVFFNKICQNDLTRYCHNGIINLLFSKFKKLKMDGGQDAQATVSSPPGVKIIRAGVKIPREILAPGGQADRGYLDPRGSSCQGVKINQYTGSRFILKTGTWGLIFVWNRTCRITNVNGQKLYISTENPLASSEISIILG